MFKPQLESILFKTYKIPVELFKNQKMTGNQCTLYYFPREIRVMKKEGYLYFDMLVDLMINETCCTGKGIGWLSSKIDFEVFDENKDPFDDDTLGLKKFGAPEEYLFVPENNDFNIALTVAYTCKLEYDKTREEIRDFTINGVKP